MQQIIDKLKKFNQEGSDVGFNSQEKEAYYCGYFEKSEKSPKLLPNYLPAKLRLLNAIKQAEDDKDDNRKMLLNAARIYAYTLFENTWFGYLAAYADCQVSAFAFKDKKSIVFTDAYRNHLPSFSSAILHFGTCRDLFFPLLKLIVHEEQIELIIKNICDAKSDDNAKKTALEKFKDEVLFIKPKGVKKKDDFMNDLKKPPFNDKLSTLGENFYDTNLFRNVFAHQLRMLWWKNGEQDKELWGFDEDDYKNIQQAEYIKQTSIVVDIFKSHREYEKKIELLEPSQFKHSAKILQETHDTIAEFLNETFALIFPDEPIA